MPADLAPSLIVLAIALAIDVGLGEPPAAVHPVVWMGRVIATLERLAFRARGAAAQLVAGAAIAIAVPAGFALAGAALIAAVRPWPAVATGLSALILTSMFAVRGLGRAARQVEDALAGGRLAQARLGLRSLCSRDPSALEAPALVAGTVESLAENASDSVVAPLFYYALFGLPGAIAYRAINTLDAMIGYHGRHEYVGKAAARLDDLCNLIPARLTAGLLLAAGACCGADVGRGWRVLRRDGGATESPNAGRPMAAMAGLLDVELAKPGHYTLGDPRAPLDARTIGRARRVTAVAMGLAAALALAAIGAVHAARA